MAKIEELANYDAIIVGTGTRFGRMSSQMANFLDQAGGLWIKGALHGKVGGAFSSTATQHGGQETNHQPAAFRHDHRRPQLRLSGLDEARRSHRRLALWARPPSRAATVAVSQAKTSWLARVIKDAEKDVVRLQAAHIDLEATITSLTKEVERLSMPGAPAGKAPDWADAKRLLKPGEAEVAGWRPDDHDAAQGQVSRRRGARRSPCGCRKCRPPPAH